MDGIIAKEKVNAHARMTIMAKIGHFEENQR